MNATYVVVKQSNLFHSIRYCLIQVLYTIYVLFYPRMFPFCPGDIPPSLSVPGGLGRAQVREREKRLWAAIKDLSAMTALHFNTNLTLINWHDVEMSPVAFPRDVLLILWKAFCDSIPVVMYKVNSIALIPSNRQWKSYGNILDFHSLWNVFIICQTWVYCRYHFSLKLCFAFVLSILQLNSWIFYHWNGYCIKTLNIIWFWNWTNHFILMISSKILPLAFWFCHHQLLYNF